ncbi:MAG: hypothetical protein LR015_09365 [Verrucomicrobia bacterium]|nr:hypothetical protein [Verrucomicrobiota bacterium]
MPNLESLARRFFADPKWLVKWLIGGVLWFLPFVNILVLGYWLRMIRNIEKDASLRETFPSGMNGKSFCWMA